MRTVSKTVNPGSNPGSPAWNATTSPSCGAARLSGLAPRIAVVAGRCFVGNAVLAGCSDSIVATENVSLGMGGPAMIAGGGLGEVDPDEVGPLEMQTRNGVVDLAVADEREAAAATKRLLGGAALRVPLVAGSAVELFVAMRSKPRPRSCRPRRAGAVAGTRSHRRRRGADPCSPPGALINAASSGWPTTGRCPPRTAASSARPVTPSGERCA